MCNISEVTLPLTKVLKSSCIKKLDEKFCKRQSHWKPEQMQYHFCQVLNILGLDFPNKMKWDLWNTRKIPVNRDDTFALNNDFDFGDSVCNTYVCFHKLL